MQVYVPKIVFAQSGEGGTNYYDPITIYTPKNDPVYAIEYQMTLWNGYYYYD